MGYQLGPICVLYMNLHMNNPNDNNNVSYERVGWLTQGPGRVVTVISNIKKKNKTQQNQIRRVYVHHLNKPLKIKIYNLIVHTHHKHFKYVSFSFIYQGKILKKLYKNGIFKFPAALSLAILNQIIISHSPIFIVLTKLRTVQMGTQDKLEYVSAFKQQKLCSCNPNDQ